MMVRSPLTISTCATMPGNIVIFFPKDVVSLIRTDISQRYHKEPSSFKIESAPTLSTFPSKEPNFEKSSGHLDESNVIFTDIGNIWNVFDNTNDSKRTFDSFKVKS